jgi:hypothetical protein
LRLLNGGSEFSYRIYQNIPSGITNITPDDSGSDFIYRTLKIENTTSIDSLEESNSLHNISFKYDKNKNVITNTVWQTKQPLRVYANGISKPRYIIFSEKDKNSNPLDTLTFDYKQLPKAKNHTYMFPYPSAWFCNITIKQENLYKRLGFIANEYLESKIF